MELLKRYFTKRYFLYFLFFFLVWYPGSFFLYIGYVVAQKGVLYVALNAYFPLLIFLFSFFYFKKSLNDWNDRFVVAFGWITITILLAALLVKPVYGFAWTSILTVSQIQMNWGPFLAVLFAGMLVKWIGKKKK